MNGFAVIILGFIAYGVLHINTPTFMPWQWCAHLFPSSITTHSSTQADDHYRYHHPLHITSFLVSIFSSGSLTSLDVLHHPRCQALLPGFANKRLVPNSGRAHSRRKTHPSESDRRRKQIFQKRTVSRFYPSSTPLSSMSLEILRNRQRSKDLASRFLRGCCVRLILSFPFPLSHFIPPSSNIVNSVRPRFAIPGFAAQ